MNQWRAQLVDNGTDRLHDLEIGSLALTPDIQHLLAGVILSASGYPLNVIPLFSTTEHRNFDNRVIYPMFPSFYWGLAPSNQPGTGLRAMKQRRPRRWCQL